jgi:hypothetical protein
MFSKKFDRRVYIALATILFALTVGASFGAFILWPSRREAGYMPDQPIAYNHKIHAGDLKIECIYCHTEADRGPHATVPPISTCMKCHDVVQTKDAEGNLESETAKLLDYWKKQEPVRWNKVNDVADFVYFDHSRHMTEIADLTCQECHGPVETFVHMKRQYGLKMGWCLDCHKEPLAEDDPRRATGQKNRAAIHCSACHR